MDKEWLAKQLDGVQYPPVFAKELVAMAKENRLIIVTGGSDELMEFDGFFMGEVDCYEGGFAYLTSDGLLENECPEPDCPYFAKIKQSAARIEAVWDNEGYSWTYQTTLPHASFDVMEGSEKYCRGIIVEMPTET
jgi:hypothetical protein